MDVEDVEKDADKLSLRRIRACGQRRYLYYFSVRGRQDQPFPRGDFPAGISKEKAYESGQQETKQGEGGKMNVGERERRKENRKKESIRVADHESLGPRNDANGQGSVSASRAVAMEETR